MQTRMTSAFKAMPINAVQMKTRMLYQDQPPLVPTVTQMMLFQQKEPLHQPTAEITNGGMRTQFTQELFSGDNVQPMGTILLAAKVQEVISDMELLAKVLALLQYFSYTNNTMDALFL